MFSKLAAMTSEYFRTIKTSEVVGFVATADAEDAYPNVMIYHYFIPRGKVRPASFFAHAHNLDDETIRLIMTLNKEYDIMFVSSNGMYKKSIITRVLIKKFFKVSYFPTYLRFF